MKVELLVNHRVFFAKGSIIEIEEQEAARLLALGFAKKAEKTEAKKVEAEKAEEVKPVKKAGRPKKEK